MAHHKILALTVLTLALVGCSAQGGNQADSSTSPAETSPVTSSASPLAASATATPSLTTSPSPQVTPSKHIPTVTEQNPDGNSSSAATVSTSAKQADAVKIPAGAREVSTVRDVSGMKVATIITPSGNIGCDIVEGQGIGCGVLSLGEQSRTAPGQIAKLGWFYFTPAEGQTYDTGRSDAPTFTFSNPQVVDYGQSVYFDRYLCTSETVGLRCSNVDTGHGMFLNRDGVETF